MKTLILSWLISEVRSLGPIQTLAVLLVYVLAPLLSASAQTNTEDFPIPTSIKTEGIRAIKKADVDHLFFEPSLIRSNLIWDVDRPNRRLLVTDEKTNIYLVASPLAKPDRLIDKKVPTTVRVSPKGDVFAFMDDEEDPDNFQLYLRLKDGTVKKLSKFDGKDEAVESIVWSRSGDALYYSQTDYDTKTGKVCVSDLSTSDCPLTGLNGIWSVMDSDEDRLLLKYWKASSEQYLHLYDLKTRKLTQVNTETTAPKGFLAQGRAFWIAEGQEECKADRCVMSMDAKTGKMFPISLSGNPVELQEIKPSPDGKSFLILETKDGIDNLRIARLKGNALVPKVGSFVQGSYVIWNTRWLSNSEVVYSVENIGKPASLESFDISSGKTTLWTKSQIPSQLENKVRAPEVIRWKSFDGKQISGYVVRPQEQKQKSPVLIFIHGGPQVVDRPTFNFQDLRLIANLGVTIIHTNIRGSVGFGNEFMDADNGPKRGDAVKDIRTLLDWIAAQENLDPDRIIVRGESYGGFIALATALQEPKRVKAVIAESPLVSIRGYLGQSWIDEFAKAEYGDPKDEKLMQELDRLSPLNNAHKWKGIPLFLTRGKLDSRVPEKDVLDLKEQLRSSSSDVWFIFDNEAGHGVGGRYVTAAMFEFLKQQLRRK
jgi:prolyl oligopeptidase PreP (S9A serine peptidase family)